MLHAQQPAPWLPQTALASARASQPFKRVVDEWRSAWFARHGWEVLGDWDASERQSAAEWSMLRVAGDATIRGKSKAVVALALTILGQADRKDLTDRDLRLLRALGGRALDDLETRLMQFLGRDERYASIGPDGGTEIYTLLIGRIGEANLSIECEKSALIRTVLGTYPNDKTASAALEMRSAAYEDQKLSIAAFLGSATLSLEQIGELEVGDVIPLDRTSDTPALLMVGEQRSALACKLGQADNRITLTMQD